MNEIFDRLIESGKKDAFSSEDKFRAAAAELGYGKEAVEAALVELDTVSLDTDTLDMVSGGVNFFMSKEKDEPSGRVI